MITEPIIRKVLNKKTGVLMTLVLEEFCFCDNCERVMPFKYSFRDPDTREYWECSDCGNTDIELNGVTE